jgi:Tfp pilus tip-associated adhesin PilY1
MSVAVATFQNDEEDNGDPNDTQSIKDSIQGKGWENFSMVSSESTTLVISDHPQKNGNSIKKTQKKWKQLKVKLLAKGIKPHPSNEQPSTTISAQNQHLPPNGRGGGLLSLKPLDRLDLAPSTLLPTLAHQDSNFKAQHLL